MVRVTIHPGNIESLIGKGLLEPAQAQDRRAIEIAVDDFINREL